MKTPSVLAGLLLPAIVGSCVPEPDSPPHAPVLAPAEGAEETVRAPGDANAIMLTRFEAAPGEICCSFHRPSQDGVPGERLFMTEIAGVPAPAAIGLEAQAVRLTQVSRTEAAGTEI